ncbi:MAG: hypothetical protein ACKVON_14660 [Beijerinckiaceae bacterium]
MIHNRNWEIVGFEKAPPAFSWQLPKARIVMGICHVWPQAWIFLQDIPAFRITRLVYNRNR